MNRLSLVALFSLLVWAAACGGGGPKYVIADQTLASIGSNEKSAIFAAQSEASMAKEELNKANYDTKAAKNELDIADNEHKAAKLKLDSAKLSKAAADQSGDLNRKNSAIKDQHLAELQLKLADAKVKWISAKKKYYDLLADSAEAHTNAAATKVELEKARLAAQKSIKPSEDFNVANYENQNMERQRTWDTARSKAEQKRLEVERAAAAYNQLQQQWNSENGIPQQTYQAYPPQQQQPYQPAPQQQYQPQPQQQLYQPQPQQPYQPQPYQPAPQPTPNPY